MPNDCHRDQDPVHKVTFRSRPGGGAHLLPGGVRRHI